MTHRTKIIMVVAVLAGVFLWGRCSKTTPTHGPNPAAVLPQEDRERIVIDGLHHTISIVTSEGVQKLSLPDRISTIDVRKDGTVNVTSPQLGWELRPFVGAHISDKTRVALGTDLWCFKKLDVGLGMSNEIGRIAPVVFGQVSYNVWSNCRVGLAYGSNKYIGATLTVRI